MADRETDRDRRTDGEKQILRGADRYKRNTLTETEAQTDIRETN